MANESSQGSSNDVPESLVIGRIERERTAQDNLTILIPHKRNYFLPLTYAREPNNDPIEDAFDEDDLLDNAEAQFQISIKVPLAEGVFTPDDSLYAAFTLRAFWQVYNDDISSPFRETNYEPELFWLTPVSWDIFGSDHSFLALGFTHQSNGRTQAFSRSWNRIYANLIWERDSFVFSFKPWWRIPEDEKDDPSDADGDDNPDIEDFLGNFEFTTTYRQNENEFSVMLRNNLDRDENKGAIQIDWAFPLNGRIRGYAQFFNGYGESLIDYNAHIERIGVGIQLNN